MIPFNVPALTGKENEYIQQVLKTKKLSGDGPFTKKCQESLQNLFGAEKVLLTTSCTDALELAAILLNIEAGDEVIMPSFTFVSTANAFVLRGAKIIFVDVDPQTMNADEELIEKAISPKTKAIVLVHYAGWSCDLDPVLKAAARHNIPIVEDAAQALGSKYKGRFLGTFGVLSCFSFHETKNINCGEGGALVINDPSLVSRAEVIREKGTNRSQFLRGQVDKYTWVDKGSSFLPSELNAAFLLAQLENFQDINFKRIQIWKSYERELKNHFEILAPPSFSDFNAHLFAIKLKDIEERSELIDFLKENEIQAVFHYVPLHSSPAGKRFGVLFGSDFYTTRESERMVRLPLFESLKIEDVEKIIRTLLDFKNL